jgi:hypothetical protein
MQKKQELPSLLRTTLIVISPGVVVVNLTDDKTTPRKQKKYVVLGCWLGCGN